MKQDGVASRIKAARLSLQGLAIGDAFGETFFGPSAEVAARIRDRTLAGGEWLVTDDTVMATAIYGQLVRNGEILQPELAAVFAENYRLDPDRGYGGTAHSVLRAIGAGEPWETVSAGVFDGMGSMGNGAAMRAGPIGAYYQDDVRMLMEQARLSAAVTHAHPEGVAGAVAVALAAGFAASETSPKATTLFRFLQAYVPNMDLKAKLRKAEALGPNADIRTAVAVLGNGLRLTAQDTVPFALWCAAHHFDDFEEALWRAVSGLGDRDTICAIVGSIVSLSAPSSTIPQTWVARTEDYERAVFWPPDT